MEIELTGHSFAFRMGLLDRSPYPLAENWQFCSQSYAMDVEGWMEFRSGDQGIYYDEAENCALMQFFYESIDRKAL